MPPVAVSHLVIPFAHCSAPAWQEAMTPASCGPLKNLQRLLRGMKLVTTDSGRADALSTPHERVLARALGLGGENLTDGLIPWAAQVAAAAGLQSRGKGWAFVTPCHWSMGREQASMTDPAALELAPHDSQLLLAAMQPYFETEGITLHYLTPDQWLAEGEILRSLPTASLDRVLGRNVDAWLPGAPSGGRRAGPPQASPAPSSGARGSAPPKAGQATSVGASILRRLQNEMQMLLYTHPLNDPRSARHLLTVNSFWLSGTGAMDGSAENPSAELTVPRTLARAVFHDDWAMYAKAWNELDANEIAACLARQNAGATQRLSLCGERNALTFETSKPGVFARISSLFSPQPALNVLAQL